MALAVAPVLFPIACSALHQRQIHLAPVESMKFVSDRFRYAQFSHVMFVLRIDGKLSGQKDYFWMRFRSSSVHQL
jgi:hypothetical protein